MTPDLNYEIDIKIDESALDVEWLEQPSIALKYARNAAECRAIERRAAELVKTIRSELVNEANEDPERATGKGKPNAQDIEAFYRRDAGYKQAKEQWIEASYEAEYAEMAQKEMSYGRKQALENLVRLHAASYFAGPSVPRDLNKEWEAKEKQKQSNAKVATTRRKKK